MMLKCIAFHHYISNRFAQQDAPLAQMFLSIESFGVFLCATCMSFRIWGKFAILESCHENYLKRPENPPKFFFSFTNFAICPKKLPFLLQPSIKNYQRIAS